MLASSIATVSGPTPPGTGVIAEAAGGHRREVDVADQDVALLGEAREALLRRPRPGASPARAPGPG